MPGTGLARDSTLTYRVVWLYVLPYLIFLLRRFIPNTFTPTESGRILADLAIQEGLLSVTDDTTAYWSHKTPIKSSPTSYDVDKQDDLWKYTVESIAESKEEKERFDRLQK
jgi:hypothetical protein